MAQYMRDKLTYLSVETTGAILFMPHTSYQYVSNRSAPIESMEALYELGDSLTA